MDILSLHKQGYSIRNIAKELKISRNTVRRYLKNSDEFPSYKLTKSRGSCLDAFKEYLDKRIKGALPEWIPATVLLKEIRTLGYKGKRSTLRNFTRRFKESKRDEPIVRFKTKP